MKDNDNYTFTDENGNEIKVETEEKKSDSLHIGKDGIHINSSDGSSVNIGKDGIHIRDKNGDSVDVDGKKATVNGKDYDYRKQKKRGQAAFPFFALATLIYVVLVLTSALGTFDLGGRNVYTWGLLIFLIVPVADSVGCCIRERKYTEGAAFITCLVAFLLIGFLFKAWHPAWIIFLFAPLINSIAEAIRNKNAAEFAMWDLCLISFLILGFADIFGISDKALWHPGWVVFLLIPVYYAFVSYIKKTR